MVKPIIFPSDDFVRAAVRTEKRATRIIIKPQPKYAIMTAAGLMTSEKPITTQGGIVIASNGVVTTWEHLPYRPGDILYVRETWCVIGTDGTHDAYGYRADGINYGTRWWPSVQMPKEAARIFFKVTGARVERVQDITEEQARAEGLKDPYDYQDPAWFERHVELLNRPNAAAYAGLWDILYSFPKPIRKHGEIVRYERYPWADGQKTWTHLDKPCYDFGNPWVLVYDLEPIREPEGWPDAYISFFARKRKERKQDPRIGIKTAYGVVEGCQNAPSKIRAYQCKLCGRLDVDDLSERCFCRAGLYPGCGEPELCRKAFVPVEGKGVLGAHY